MHVFKMEGQTMLTNYFTAGKSRQNSHPAKRRKVVADTGVIPSKSAKLNDAKCVSLSQEKLNLNAKASCTPTASGRVKQASRSRTVKSKTRSKDVQRKVVSEGVISMTTSLKDDHSGKRSRKASQVNNGLGSSADIFELVKSSVNGHAEAKPSQTGAVKGKASNTELSKAEGSKTEVKITSVPEKPESTNAGSNSVPKTTNITSNPRAGLKQNPWIAEQAKLVLASRGKQALEKSLGRKKETGSLGKVAGKGNHIATRGTLKAEKPSHVDLKLKGNVPRLSEGMGTKPTNVPESGANLPAYKRFSHLLEAKKPKSSGDVMRNLPLPYHFKVLEEMFRCVDIVLSLKQKRYETCTFEKLKDSVQEMCRKKFEKKHLAQIKTVYPTAFIFRQQSNAKKTDHQLTIDFNFDGSQKPKDFKFIESYTLIARQKQFRNALHKITIGHHREYLAKNYPSLSVDDDAIMRWHPCFKLDDVPEIDQSPLPEPPQVKTFSTALDVLGQARLNMTPRVEKALNTVASKSSEIKNIKASIKANENKSDSNQTNSKNPSLKGVSQSLIDKIRQKEEKKIQESLTADSEVVQKRVMMQRLPELCRILKTYFVSERKAAIPLEDVSNKLAESYTSTLSPVHVEKHVKLLSEVAPEWLAIMHVRKCPYVKLKKNINMNILMEKLKSKEIN